MVDMTDLKSVGTKVPCGFDSHPRYKIYNDAFSDGASCSRIILR
jgi:hypothetical protein